MLTHLKQKLKDILGYALTITSCVAIIVFGISFLGKASSPVTTSIGENIITNDLLAYGNATTTGNHYIGGQLITANIIASSTSATSTIAGRLELTKIPTEAHAFSVWTTDAANSNVLDASLVINPASAGADTNLFGIAVNGNVKFLVDAEGDVFVNNLTATGTVTQATTNISTLTVENTANLGDAITDTVNFVAGNIVHTNTATTTILQQVNAYSIATSTTAIPIFSVDGSNGYVGIGAVAPSSKFQVVNGNTTFDAIQAGTAFGELINIKSTTDDVGFRVQTGGASKRASLILQNYTDGMRTDFDSYYNGIFTIEVNDSEMFTIDTSGAQDELVLNNYSGDIDFRVESDNSLNALFVQGSDGNVGIGTNVPSANLHVMRGDTSFDILSVNDAFGSEFLATDDTNFIRGGAFIVERNGTNTTAVPGTMGLNAFAILNGNETSTNSNTVGGRYAVRSSTGSGSTTWAKGVSSSGFQGSGGSTAVENAIDYYGEGSTSWNGNMTNAYNFYGTTHTEGGSGSITNAYGLYLEDQTAGDTNYSIYSAGGTNYFNGNTGIGTTSPYAKLSVVGETVSEYFTATSTTATSTLAGGLNVGSGGLVYDYSSGNVGIGTNAPTNIGSLRSVDVYDGRIIFTGSGVDHGMTSVMSTTNVAGNLGLANSSRGGLAFVGASEGLIVPGLSFEGILGSTDPPDTLSSIKFTGFKKNGTSITALGADETVVQFLNNTDVLVTIMGDGNVGIGTTSPYAKLSVVGETVAEYFTATSTTATSTFAGGLNVGTNGLVYDYSTGNVGIGTSAPTAPLTINRLNSSNQYAYFNTDGTDEISIGAGSIDIDEAYKIDSIELAYHAWGPTRMQFDRNAQAELFSFFENSTVGENKEVRLYGYPTGAAATGYASFQITGANNDLQIMNSNSSGNFIFGNGIATTTLDSSGNFGIGTSSPYAKLSVAGETVAEYFTATSTTASSTFAGGLNVGSGGLVYDSSSGRIGIGTNTPSRPLHIRRTDGDASFFLEDVSNGTGYFFGSPGGVFRIREDTYAGVEFLRVNPTSAQKDAVFNYLASDIDFRVAATGEANALFVQGSNGYVGIGTSSPTTALEVNGVLTARTGTLTTTLGSQSNQLKVYNTGGLARVLAQTGGAGSSAMFRGQNSSGDAFDFMIDSSSVAHFKITDVSVLQSDGATTIMNADQYDIDFRVDGSSISNALFVEGSSGFVSVGTSSPYAKLSIWGDGTSGATAFNVVDSASSTLFRVLDDGKVGIGPNAPSARVLQLGLSDSIWDDAPSSISVANSYLHLGGLEQGMNNYYMMTFGPSWRSNPAAYMGYQITNVDNRPYGDLIFGTSNSLGDDLGVERMRIAADGNIGIGTTSPYAKLSIEQGAGETPFIIGSSTATNLIVDSSGNVGIGTASPTNELDVVGSGSFTSSSGTVVIGGARLLSLSHTSDATAQVGNGAVDAFFSFRLLNSLADWRTGIANSTGNWVVQSQDWGGQPIAISPSAYMGGALNLAGTEIVINDESLSLDFRVESNNDDNALFVDASSDNVGIGTSSPYAKLSVWGDGTSGAEAFNVVDSASSTIFSVLDSGFVGIGTNAPDRQLHVKDSAASSIRIDAGADSYANIFLQDDDQEWIVRKNNSDDKFLIYDLTQALTPFTIEPDSGDNLLYLASSGNVGVGSSSPFGTFAVEQQDDDTIVFLVADTGTTTPHIKVDGRGVTSIGQLETGALSFDTNAGAVTWIDMPVDSTVASNTVESFTAKIDSNDILTVSALSDGTGKVNTMRVGIGTSSPGATFAVQGNALADAWLIYELAEMDLFPENKNDVFEEGDLLSISDEDGGFVKANINDGFPIVGIAKDVEVWNSTSIKPAVLGTFTLKVSTENGDIYTGDYLTKSSVDGIAMRANEGDETVGFALDDYYGNGVGIIKMFINVDKQGGQIDGVGSSLLSPTEESFNIANSFDWIIDKFKLMGVTFKNGLVKAKEFVADKVTTDELCLEDVCIDKNGLRELLEKNQIQIGSSQPEPEPIDEVDDEIVVEDEDTEDEGEVAGEEEVVEEEVEVVEEVVKEDAVEEVQEEAIEEEVKEEVVAIVETVEEIDVEEVIEEEIVE